MHEHANRLGAHSASTGRTDLFRPVRRHKRVRLGVQSLNAGSWRELLQIISLILLIQLHTLIGTEVLIVNDLLLQWWVFNAVVVL